MGVIQRCVWGTMALGVLAILGGTSALAFTGGPEDSVAADTTGTRDERTRPAEPAPGSSAASVPAPDPSAASRWMAPHTISGAAH